MTILPQFEFFTKQEAGMLALKDELLTVDELTAYFKVNRRTIYRMLEDNELPFAIKVRGHWRFRLSDVEKWLENNKIGMEKLS